MQSLPPLTGDGDSVHEVFQKQSTRIGELEKDNKRLEKELSDATARWRKTEDQLEDLREASVDGTELREQLKKAEEKAAGIESLVWDCLFNCGSSCQLTKWAERRDSCAAAAELTAPISLTPEQCQRRWARDIRVAACGSRAPAGIEISYY